MNATKARLEELKAAIIKYRKNAATYQALLERSCWHPKKYRKHWPRMIAEDDGPFEECLLCGQKYDEWADEAEAKP